MMAMSEPQPTMNIQRLIQAHMRAVSFLDLKNLMKPNNQTNQQNQP
eukprot:CAMPEP_0175148470 /NCGR_PEP_ID=MMETSP0087-20121206/16643_1 /TAXON_ID=136419 /ORGANISM="Unknown Unknown, Strain D1" /LENGTH=45 /DNA_ID= /DNA_START= /DNA_END= /DNA_ORIENTATION=